MTELLEQAMLNSKPLCVYAKLKTLSANEQDALAKLSEGLAAMILSELEDEVRWDATFANSQDALAKLAAEAMAEYRAGKTQELDPETL
ncbi:hypothetical protein BLD44_002745 [Mastigocladus laminosus UU774]|nr:hypothetical protein BLD44_002745 [Mastigocladus laminosus UU774]